MVRKSKNFEFPSPMPSITVGTSPISEPLHGPKSKGGQNACNTGSRETAYLPAYPCPRELVAAPASGAGGHGIDGARDHLGRRAAREAVRPPTRARLPRSRKGAGPDRGLRPEPGRSRCAGRQPHGPRDRRDRRQTGCASGRRRRRGGNRRALRSSPGCHRRPLRGDLLRPQGSCRGDL